MQIFISVMIILSGTFGYGAVKKFDIGLIYGYNDQHPDLYVIDNFQMQKLVRDLTRPCQRAEHMVCGFHLQPGYLNTLIRRIQNIEVTLYLQSSSYTTYDPTNRDPQYFAQQQSKSQQALELFKTSLSQFDATFYVGHARHGSGPDFFILNSELIGKKPPRNLSKINEVITLTATNSSNPHVYLLACDSEIHWKARIQQRHLKKNQYYVLNSIIKPDQVDLLTRQLLDRYLKTQIVGGAVNLPKGVVRIP